MKTIALSLAAGALAFGIGLANFAEAQPSASPVTIEGADKPILLGRVTVTATALPGAR